MRNRTAGLTRLTWLGLLNQVFRLGLDQVGRGAELVERGPKHRLAGVQRDLAIFQFAVGIVQRDAEAALLAEVGQRLGQRRVLVDEVNLRSLENLGAFDALFDVFHQLFGAAANLGVLAGRGLFQRLQGGFADGVQLFLGVFAVVELIAAHLVDELADFLRRGGQFRCRAGQRGQQPEAESHDQDRQQQTLHHLLGLPLTEPVIVFPSMNVMETAWAGGRGCKGHIRIIPGNRLQHHEKKKRSAPVSTRHIVGNAGAKSREKRQVLPLAA